MGDVVIKIVSTEDVETLQQISRQTFTETFSGENSEEDMVKYLEDNLSSEKLSKELTEDNSVFYFAMLDSKVIGYLKINFGQAQTEIRDNNALEIERIYVLKDFHGFRVGQLLYEQSIKAATEKNADYMWLGVWEENHRAINFYKKNGFIAFDKHIFRLGNDEQTDIMMKLELHK